MDEQNHRQPARKSLHRDSQGGQREGSADFSPARGDLYVSPLTSFLGIEWAVLRFGTSREILFAIPADLDTRRGSRDLEIPADAAAGPLTLRCGQGLWLASTVFAPDLHSGRLEEVYSRLALDRVTSIEENALQITYPDKKAEALPAYRRWIRQGPLMARDIMAQHSAAATPRLQPTAKARYAPLRLAAIFILPLLLSILSVLLWTGKMTSPWDSESRSGPDGMRSAAGTVIPNEIVNLRTNLVDDYRPTTRGVPATPRESGHIQGQDGLYYLTLWDPDLEATKSYHLRITNRDSGKVHLAMEVHLRPESADQSAIPILLRMAAYPPGHYTLLLKESGEGTVILDLHLDFAPEIDHREPVGSAPTEATERHPEGVP